ncbi:MAG: hypothetical protein AAF512_22950, partial [Pseudomonadota bacterium]
ITSLCIAFKQDITFIFKNFLPPSSQPEAAAQSPLCEHQGTAPGDAPLFTMHFKKGDLELSFFSTYTSFGTPHDVALQELRIECFFPADESTREYCHRHARK